MNMAEYVQAALRTEKPWEEYPIQETSGYDRPRLAHAVLGLTSELVELRQALRNLHSQEPGVPNRTNLKEELGDIMWFWALAYDVISGAWAPGSDPLWLDAADQSDHDLFDLTDAISGLADEAKGVIIYGRAIHGRYVAMVDRLADIQAVTRRIAQDHLIGWDDLLESNIAKLRARFPDKFDESKNIARDRGAEAKALQAPGE